MKHIMSFAKKVLLLTASMLITSINTEAADNCAVYSNIMTYINHYPIKSYCINGSMAVCINDLADFGFALEVNDSAKSINVVRDYSKTVITAPKIPQTEVFPDMLGTKIADVQRTGYDIFINGSWTPSYNLNGYAFIGFDSLCAFGELYWIPELSCEKLWLEGLPVTSYTPPLPGYRYSYKTSQSTIYGSGRLRDEISFVYPVFETTRYSDVFTYLNNLISAELNAAYSDASELMYEATDYGDMYVPFSCDQQIDITYDANGIICLRGYGYSYTGGAHGYGGYYELGCYSIYDGHRLYLNDFIYTDNLSQLMKKIFTTQNSPSQFWEDLDFGDTDGFYMTPYGIRFFANPYNFSAYACGIVEATLYCDSYPARYKNFIQYP